MEDFDFNEFFAEGADDCIDDCPVHSRTEKYEYNPSEGIEKMLGVSYVGNYAVFTDDDVDSLPKDPASLAALLFMTPEELNKHIGYITKVFYVGDGPLLKGRTVADRVWEARRQDVRGAQSLHISVVDHLTMGGTIEQLDPLH
jgi:hypothetical protein